jgi:tetrahydromethanopterin S-methyltransferase subunit B
MIINKAHWVTEGDNVRFSMPIGKVDQERRLVSGFATLDNIDRQNDIVTTEASLEAFKKFRGNIREMHSSLAVGKIISFKEDKYFDPESKKFYSGVYVSAYVSKGAQDTWEKVLDGTLTGFSIGGNITKSDDSFDEKLDKTVRIIKEYELHELSLVDNPANQFANVISIQKSDGINVVGGYLSKAIVDNVYWCNSDDIVRLSSSNEESCPSCDTTMKNIGFVEKNDTDNVETVKFLVDSAKGIRTIKMTKEENPMTEETTTIADATTSTVEEVANVEVAPEATAEATPEVSAEETPAEPVAEAGAEEETPATEEAEKSVDTNTDPAQEIAKSVANINDSLTNALSNIAETVKSMQTTVDAITKSLEAVTGEVKSVASEVKEVKGNFNEFGKRVDAVEQDTAFRKSGDLGEIVQEFAAMPTQKSLWGGRFLTNTDLFN